MKYGMYGRFAEWWPLLSPPEDYEGEAKTYGDILAEDGGEGATLLELGSGGGHLASHLTGRFAMTLSDLSPEMLAVSRALNPGVEHHESDMRTLRLGRTFDRVLIHDAIMYMVTPADLKAALTTAYTHLRPGGRAVFVPDELADTYEPWTSHGGSESADGRAMRYLEWSLPLDPATHRADTIYALVMRDADGTVESSHDLHATAVFPRALWFELLAEVGFEAESRVVPVDDISFGSATLEVFIGRRPVGEGR